ncbi:hypothetical protein BKA82DRAFT_950511 [Pisolithus tinctorius]|uniref:Zn(2)-C6 fungal-type domain-containing protein n=1 Tax=Pisolithus tinctorius Marx 270 TaxID=870435 RepID=A0A0C3J613_PISTI|nr:hypothetical protein BKA82DRAFT_950511 [Pisolithus tinctorius]KIO04503.1 hypothetical protein M404DRAFT_950511 [Pisolithus tinctorius Marx 270]
MDTNFQFIFESPNASQGHKKRPRLVTSCDNCRLKKIKCLQPSPETQCEACTSAKIPCRFRDRERYFAERSRAIAGPSSPTMYIRPASSSVAQDYQVDGHPAEYSSGQQIQVSCSNPPSASHSSQRSSYSPPGTGYGNEGHARSQSYTSSEISKPSGVARWAPQRIWRLYPTYHGPDIPNQPSHYRVSQLFEPGQPQFPRRDLMSQFITLFISHMGGQCPFLTYEDLYDRWRRQTMSALMANCIAALGARASEIPEVVARGSSIVAETYCEIARELLTASLNQPTLETLHCVMLLAWSEYKAGRPHGFRQYGDLAMRTAMAIGLSEQSLQLSPYDPYQNRVRITWTSVNQMQLYASSSTCASLHEYISCKPVCDDSVDIPT